MKEKEVRIFIAYARTDKPYLEQLKKALVPLQKQTNIRIWDDTQLSIGVDWWQNIHAELDQAHLVIMLVSIDFLASDYCTEEQNKAWQRYQQGGVVIAPIIVRPCDWKRSEIGKLQTLLKGNAVSKYPDQDDAYVHICDELEVLIQEIIGDADYCYNKGKDYCDGNNGVQKDDDEAVKWFRKAAEQGHAGGQNNLGCMYEYGRGVNKNQQEAVQWYILAAKQGNEFAISRLKRLRVSWAK